MTLLRRRPAMGAVPRRGGGPVAAEVKWAWLFLAPTLIGLAILSAGPILATLGISLTRWDLLRAPEWVGLDNFGALVGDGRFLVALRNTTLTKPPPFNVTVARLIMSKSPGTPPSPAVSTVPVPIVSVA
jgi:multiple sugar transport system permease protein